MTRDLYRRELSERRRHEHRQAVLFGLLAAILLHYPLLHFAVWVAGFGPDSSHFEVVSFTEVQLIDGLDLSADMTDEERKKKLDELDERDDKDAEDELVGQVVDLPPQPDRSRPEETKYLARYDSATDEEMVRRGTPSGGMGAIAGAGDSSEGRDGATVESIASSIRPPEIGREGPTSEQDQEEQAPAEDRADTRAAHPRARRLALLRADEAELSLEADGERRPSPDRPGTSNPLGPRSYESMLPPMIAGGVGGEARGTDDYLPDVERGDRTLLNARRFKYWSFFQRVKTALLRQWRPGHEYRMADPTGRVYGVRDRMTVLSVTLNRDGTLKALNVIEESGVTPLDNEAVRAFEAAQPFPNPPPGLVDDNGEIQFMYALHLDIQTGWSFKPLWMPRFR